MDPDERNEAGCNGDHDLFTMLQQQQKLLLEIMKKQNSMQQKQKEFDEKLLVVEQHVSKFNSSTELSGSNVEARRHKITRDLSVSQISLLSLMT